MNSWKGLFDRIDRIDGITPWIDINGWKLKSSEFYPENPVDPV
jgi:hypothetical protein